MGAISQNSGVPVACPSADGSAHVPARRDGWRAKLADYWTLTKPEVNTLVVASTLAGFYLGWRGPMNFVLLFHTLMGTLLVASGTATLNQWMEREGDAQCAGQ